jgi:hypothetical protein
MELIGELERAIVPLLYPNRVVIGIAVALALASVFAVAWRRGWLRAAGRHPVASAIGVIAALAVVLPMGWYLGSPLVLSTTIDEPPPAVAMADPSMAPAPPTPMASEPPATPTPMTGESPVPSQVAPPPPSPAPEPTAEPLLERTGSFRGADDFHFGEGTARLIETAPGEFVVRLEGFAVRNGPDLFVYLSPERRGYDDAALELGRLKADRGNQNYRVPAGLDIDDAASVVIWCRQFSQLFATAPLR